MDFLPIPYCVIQDKKMKHADEKVMGLVYYMDVRRQDPMKMSNAFIGNTLNMAAGTVSNSLKKLQDAGYVNCYYKDAAKRIRSHITSNIVTGLVTSTDEGGSTPEWNRVPLTDEQNKITNKITNKTAGKSLQVQKGIEVCRRLNPLAAQSWYRIPTQRENAEIIAGLVDKNEDKLNFLISKAIEYRSEQYFPKVNSPYDLVNKLQKVQDALKERGVFYKQVDTTIEDDADELGYSIDG